MKEKMLMFIESFYAYFYVDINLEKSEINFTF